MKLQINITKEVLEASKLCLWNNVGQNCAIGRAIVDVFGLRSWVNGAAILLYKEDINDEFTNVTKIATIKLPVEAMSFVTEFDELLPEKRVLMNPFSFEIDVPDEILEQIIDISEIETILSNAKYINPVLA